MNEIRVFCPQGCGVVVYRSTEPGDTQRMAELRAARYVDRHVQWECDRRPVRFADGSSR